MNWEGYFFFIILFILVATTGVDRMVTGVIKPDVERQVFLAYVLWQTILNQAVAIGLTLMYRLHNVNPLKRLTILIYSTTVWCWVGGSLDFLYFMMKGSIPPASHVWSWMPFQPTTVEFAVYAFCFLCIIVGAWIWHLTRKEVKNRD